MGKGHKHIPPAVSVVLFLLLTTLFFYLSISVVNEIPQVMEYNRSRLSSGITFAIYEKLPNKSYTKNLSVYTEQNAEIIDGIGEVKPVLVNESFFSVYGIHVGGFAITADYITDKTPAVVISDKAAMKISVDGNVIGQQITLYSKSFTIVGIYKKSDGFLREISSDIHDRVYIPYTCYDGYEEIDIDSLAASKDSYSEKALPLLGLTETDKSFYIQNDLSVKRAIIANFPNLFISILSLVIGILCLKILIRLSKNSYRTLKSDYSSYTISEVIRHNIGFILIRFLYALFLIGIPTTLLILFPPKIILPQNYIPLDNLFDLNHYTEVFKSSMQLSNSDFAVGNTYFNHLFSTSMIFLSSSLVVMMTLLLSIAAHLRLIISNQPH